MELHISLIGRKDLSGEIYRQLRRAILDHQWPPGVAMVLPRRLALLDWAERNNAAIIEDDYDSEFRFGGCPIEPLQTLDASGRVVYVGSFSKTLVPTRIGAVVGRASEVGVEVQELSRFAVDGARWAGLLLGYGAIPTADRGRLANLYPSARLRPAPIGVGPGSSDARSTGRTGRPIFPAHSSVSSKVFPISKRSVRSRRARSLSAQSTVRCTSTEDHWPNSL